MNNSNTIDKKNQITLSSIDTRKYNGLFTGFKGNLIIFFIGGLIVMTINLLSEYSEQKYAALMTGIPYTLYPVLIYMYMRGEDSKTISQYGYSTLLTFTGLAMFVLTIAISVRKMNFWTSLGLSTVVLIISLLCIMFVLCPSPFKNGKCIKVK